MKNLTIFSIMLCILLAGAHSVLAAQLLFTPEQLTVGIQQQFFIEFFLSTKDSENINAIEGTLLYPHDLLDLKEIQDGNSIINFWIERPNRDTLGRIRFSGITPGGYQGQQGFIFGMTFQAVTSGDGVIEIREQNVLQNDGNGMSANVEISHFQFSISQQIQNSKLHIPNSLIDTDPPEAFTLEIARDPHLFDNKWFVVFATQDKGSGIDYYEVQEQQDRMIQSSSWIRAQSPYVLQDQGRTSSLWVRAVDNAGNIRVAALESPGPSPQYTRYFVWSILGVLVIVCLLIHRLALWRKQKRKK